MKTLPPRFSSPPLLEGLLQSVHEVLGATTKATPIQSLSLKHLFKPPVHLSLSKDTDLINDPPSPAWNQYLLASETGSGKSIAYMLPMFQYLKLTENSPAPLPDCAPPSPKHLMNSSPRGLILAPTHELSRQLSSFAKALLHNVRLRVVCTSQANTLSSSRGRTSTASQFKRELARSDFGLSGESQFSKKGRPIDILVSTPAKILEMTRGWGWDKAEKIEDDWDEARKERARNWIPGNAEASLALIEWVVVDEADILFDKDFQETTRLLLADIARARGYEHPSFSSLKMTFMPSPDVPNAMPPIAYPFNLVLTSATIPSSLSTYLSVNHPELTRLASPKLHQLPTTLKTEHYAYTSGNKNVDVEKRIRSVWAEDSASNRKARSKVLIFCNKSSKVDDLHLYLKEQGIANIPLTSDGQARHHGSNRHLAGFLKTKNEEANLPPADTLTDPHVMITTSLLSRGLDFSPQIKHVFILDEPRNMIDFLHRAGRSGRAGNEGHVVIFGKMKGRGSGSARDVKRKIYALAH
ncbi:P-loop containing nucleoside triphosphate hydrolase protein [Hysterangium stoloniferum]|nr:P-loop containing nucleoside triphosphate hydrolase protein [Hysterangium stoloniferum]